MIELIGIIGGGLFAAGCVPMAFQTWKLGRDVGTPLSTQWLLFLACIVYSVYLFAAFGSHSPFWFLVIEVASWGIALWYHYFPRRKNVCFGPEFGGACCLDKPKNGCIADQRHWEMVDALCLADKAVFKEICFGPEFDRPGCSFNSEDTH